MIRCGQKRKEKRKKRKTQNKNIPNAEPSHSLLSLSFSRGVSGRGSWLGGDAADLKHDEWESQTLSRGNRGKRKRKKKKKKKSDRMGEGIHLDGGRSRWSGLRRWTIDLSSDLGPALGNCGGRQNRKEKGREGGSGGRRDRQRPRQSAPGIVQQQRLSEPAQCETEKPRLEVR